MNEGVRERLRKGVNENKFIMNVVVGRNGSILIYSILF